MGQRDQYEKVATSMMQRFDFDHVAKIMQRLDWRWDFGGENRIPTTHELMDVARRLILVTLKTGSRYERTGGFSVTVLNGIISLSFELEQAFAMLPNQEHQARRVVLELNNGSRSVPKF